MGIQRCTRCDEFLFRSATCECVSFEVYDQDNDPDLENPETVWSAKGLGCEYAFEEVATTYAERADATSAEYSCVGGSPMTVVVERDGVRKWFEVEGETVPRYSAREVQSRASGAGGGDE